jgi:hypothetical protein
MIGLIQVLTTRCLGRCGVFIKRPEAASVLEFYIMSSLSR